jgi:hypothetical protein
MVCLVTGQLWETTAGGQLRITDPAVAAETDLYYAPVQLHVDVVSAPCPGVSESGDAVTISRERLLCEYRLSEAADVQAGER